jgi:hypothetical protein
VKRAILLMTLALAALAPLLARGQSANSPAAGVGGNGVLAQELAGQAYYLSLLELYGLESASSATPATRAQLSQAMSEYFSNGAGATGVPTAGPVASYFTSGADVSTIPTSVMPNYSFSPAFPAATASPTVATTATAPPDAGDAAVPFDASGTAVPRRPAPPAPPSDYDAAAAAIIAPPSPADTLEPPWQPAPPRAPAAALTPASAPEPASAPTPASQSAPAPAPEEMTRSSAIIIPMAAGVGFAGLLIALGLRIHPRFRR